MNAEELKTEFGLEFPTEIDGYKRPGALENGHDWFLEIPQIIAKDKVLYTGMNLILSALLSNEKLLKQWHDILQNVVNEQDWRVVTDSLKGYMTPELKKKLDGIATGANNYIHPSSHPATMITQDATHRFVTDTEKNTWNGKASTAVVSTSVNGLAPKRDGNASHFLAGDGTWKVVPSASSAATATKATQDSRGQQIDTTYVKGVTGSNATLTVTKGNGTTSTVTVNNVANATKATQDSAGQQINTTYVKGVTGNNATLTVTKGNGTTSTITINNVGNSTKATQDSQGQAINTTYIKSITASNATLTVTKGNGTTSAVTINNVAHSTDADNAGKLNNKGDISASTLPNNFTTGLTTHSAYNGNYPSQYGNVININNKGKSQIFMEWKGDDNAAGAPGGIWYRECRDNQNVWSNWAKIAYLTDCTDTLKKVYPVGSIYMSTVSTNPATLFGFGTWEAMPAGRVLLAQGKSSWGTTYNAGSTGGEATHQLTVGEMPSHNHIVSIQSSGEHNHTASSNKTGTHSHVLPTANALGSGSGYVIGTSNGGNLNTTGNGEHSHVITINNNGSHTHNTTVTETGSGQAHSNMPPYLALYIWKRIS